MSAPAKTGERFSHLYIQQRSPLPDNPRFRVRLGHYIVEHFNYKFCEPLQVMLTRELGVPMPKGGTTHPQTISLFLQKAEIHDVLDAATLIYRQMKETYHHPSVADEWKMFVDRVFKETNVAYVVDKQCGVHPFVDREFARNIATAVAGLGMPRYEAARLAFQAAEKKLQQVHADVKSAIRDTFEAAETLTKLISNSGKSLTAAFVKAELEPRVQALYSDDAVATMVAARMAQSFADWVDAAHPYRHGQNSEEPIDPPEELVVLLVSQGAAFLRWLVDLDARLGRDGKRN